MKVYFDRTNFFIINKQQPPPKHQTFVAGYKQNPNSMQGNTVKLDNKERFDKEQIGIKEP